VAEECKEGINKNRVIDNLDDLDREFCKTWDKLAATFDELLRVYKRIMIRAYEIKEKNVKLKSDFLAQSSDIRSGLDRISKP